MQFFIFTLLPSFFVGLFCVYSLARDDFLLLRKNITLEQVFNIAFVASGIGLLAARLGYVLFHPSIRFINPLIFFIVPYFPGLSLSFGLIGSTLYVLWYTKKKKIPTGRLSNIFMISLLLALTFAHVIQLVAPVFARHPIAIWESIPIFLLSMSFALLIWLFEKGYAKDGIIATCGTMVISLITLVTDVVTKKTLSLSRLNKEDIIFAILFIVSVFIFPYIQQIKLPKKK